MKRLIFTILLSSLLVSLSTCKKDHSGSGNPLENTDQDYFECKVDGVQWGGHLDHIDLFYYCACDSTLNFTAYRKGDNFNQTLTLVSTEVVVGDTGNFVSNSGGAGMLINYEVVDPCTSSKYYAYSSGKIFLEEHNTTQHYLKGTFFINGAKPNCPTDTVMEITEGRFLVHY